MTESKVWRHIDWKSIDKVSLGSKVPYFISKARFWLFSASLVGWPTDQPTWCLFVSKWHNCFVHYIQWVSEGLIDKACSEVQTHVTLTRVYWQSQHSWVKIIRQIFSQGASGAWSVLWHSPIIILSFLTTADVQRGPGRSGGGSLEQETRCDWYCVTLGPHFLVNTCPPLPLHVTVTVFI